MTQSKLNPTQVLGDEIKLRGTPRFNFHTSPHIKINPNPIRIKQVEPNKSNNSNILTLANIILNSIQNF